MKASEAGDETEYIIGKKIEIMIRKLTKGLKAGLVFAGLAITIGNAEAERCNDCEWRDVFKIDFGGNNESDPGMMTTAPTGENAVETDLHFMDIYTPQEPGGYYVAKSADQVIEEWQGTISNAADGNSWLRGGDHTNEGTDQKGYFMMFDCQEDHVKDVEVFRRSLPVACTGVKFRFSSWFANMSKSGEICDVLIAIEDANQNTLKKSNDWSIPGGGSKLNWMEQEIEFEVTDPNVNLVYFKIYAVKPEGNGFDFALDDITVSVEQPVLTITNSDDFNYKMPVSLVATYDKDDFSKFFGGALSSVKYRWEYKATEDGTYTQLKEGSYSSGADLSYKIDAFEKDKHNGFYKLTVATDVNMDNSLCSIQKVFQINEEKDKATVTICEEGKDASYSGKVNFYGTVLSLSDGVVQTVNNSITVSLVKQELTKLDDQINDQCVNSTYPDPGKILLSTDYTYKEPEHKMLNDTRECVKTKQDVYMDVKEGLQNAKPMKLCKGDSYKQYDEANPNEVAKVYNELGETEVKFDSSECKYKRVITVYDTSEGTENVYLCVGDTYDGVTYKEVVAEKPGTPRDTVNENGCKHTITPLITVSEPVIEDLGRVERCSDEPPYMFGDKTYSEPMDEDLELVEPIPNGCKKITRVHLTIHPSGALNMDTLICRDQILFGTEYTTAGTFVVNRSGVTSSGCPVDTVWKVTVVEIQLKLRVAFNQTDVCEGSPLELITTLVPQDAVHRWEPAVPNNALRPTIWPEETTTYKIYADLDLPSDVDGNAKGCHAVEEVTINVHPVPDVVIDSVDVDAKTVEFTVEGGTMPYTVVENGKEKITNMTENTAVLENQLFGKHTLEVTDDVGCSDSETYDIEAKPVETSPVFTPNKDGINDVWVVPDLLSYPNCSVRIYDRYGKQVYSGTGTSASNNETGFNGDYNGKPLPSADYWYEISIDEIDKTYVGHFTLIR